MTYTYFAHDEAAGLIKIGKSANPKRRLRDLEMRHKCRLTAIGCCEKTTLTERKALDLMDPFSAGSTRGIEWFAMKPQDLLDRLFTAAGVTLTRLPESSELDVLPKIPLTITISEDVLECLAEIAANSRPRISRNALIGYALEEWATANHPGVANFYAEAAQ